jgi:hypothetical protein
MRPENRPGVGADATVAVACVSGGIAGAETRCFAGPRCVALTVAVAEPATVGRSYNASSLGNGTAGFSFANGVASRVFDTISRQPMLNAINVQLQKNGPVFGKLELTAGTNANVIASYPYANNPNPLQTAFDVTQAYVGYTSGALAVQAGKFETLAGAEVIEDPANQNVSRSILFGYAVPFTHTGARVTYTLNPTISLIAGVNNGWDNLKGPGGPKTTELGIAYNGPILSVTAQSYLGMERYSNAMWSATGDSPFAGRAPRARRRRCDGESDAEAHVRRQLRHRPANGRTTRGFDRSVRSGTTRRPRHRDVERLRGLRAVPAHGQAHSGAALRDLQ